MKIEKIAALRKSFDSISHLTEEGIEYWLARELQSEFGYNRWENFEKAIVRAIESCISTGIEKNDHFRDITKMVPLGSGSQRSISDYMLTRYARYLIA